MGSGRVPDVTFTGHTSPTGPAKYRNIISVLVATRPAAPGWRLTRSSPSLPSARTVLGGTRPDPVGPSDLDVGTRPSPSITTKCAATWSAVHVLQGGTVSKDSPSSAGHVHLAVGLVKRWKAPCLLLPPVADLSHRELCRRRGGSLGRQSDPTLATVLSMPDSIRWPWPVHGLHPQVRDGLEATGARIVDRPSGQTARAALWVSLRLRPLHGVLYRLFPQRPISPLRHATCRGVSPRSRLCGRPPGWVGAVRWLSSSPPVRAWLPLQPSWRGRPHLRFVHYEGHPKERSCA